MANVNLNDEQWKPLVDKLRQEASADALADAEKSLFLVEVLQGKHPGVKWGVTFGPEAG